MATALSAEFLAASAEGPNSSWPKEGRVPPQQPMVRRLRKKALQGLIVSAVECRGASTIRVKLGGRIEADRLMRCPSAVRPSTIPRSLRSASAVRSTWPGSAGAAGRKRTQPVKDRVQPPSTYTYIHIHAHTSSSKPHMHFLRPCLKCTYLHVLLYV